MTDKIIRFPIRSYEKERNRRGKRTVSCIVENRYLTFGLPSEQLNCGTPVHVQVMSENEETGKARNLCGLYITIEELEGVLTELKARQVTG